MPLVINGVNYAHHAQLAGTDFSGATIHVPQSTAHVNFAGANLQNAIFQHPPNQIKILHECNFTQANLQGASLQGFVFVNCTFVGAQLQGANFEGSRFIQANFGNAQLQGANFNATYTSPPNTFASAIGGDSAHWEGAAFYQSVMQVLLPEETSEEEMDISGGTKRNKHPYHKHRRRQSSKRRNKRHPRRSSLRRLTRFTKKHKRD